MNKIIIYIIILCLLNSSSIYAKDFPVNNEFTVKERIDCAVQASIKYNVPVDVLLAISSIENGNIDTISKNTNNTYDYGVMQINSDYIKDLNSKLNLNVFHFKQQLINLKNILNLTKATCLQDLQCITQKHQNIMKFIRKK